MHIGRYTFILFGVTRFWSHVCRNKRSGQTGAARVGHSQKYLCALNYSWRSRKQVEQRILIYRITWNWPTTELYVLSQGQQLKRSLVLIAFHQEGRERKGILGHQATVTCQKGLFNFSLDQLSVLDPQPRQMLIN